MTREETRLTDLEESMNFLTCQVDVLISFLRARENSRLRLLRATAASGPFRNAHFIQAAKIQLCPMLGVSLIPAMSAQNWEPAHRIVSSAAAPSAEFNSLPASFAPAHPDLTYKLALESIGKAWRTERRAHGRRWS